MRFLSLGLTLAILLLAVPAAAICVCFPCEDCELRSFGQMNFVVMERDRGLVRVVPNIRIVGEAKDFALVVPTPDVPWFEPAPAELWNELLEITRTQTRSGTGCGASDPIILASDVGDTEERVEILKEQTVGAFHAFTVRSDSPDALADWLKENGYSASGVSSEILAPLVERGWVFTAMKLDTERVQAPLRWDANVDPVMFVYPARDFEMSLPFFTLNRGSYLPMSFFVVDDSRTALPGFETKYGNAISEREARGFRATYPETGAYLHAGRYLTRLDHTFQRDAELSGWLQLPAARAAREVGTGSTAAVPAFPLFFAGTGVALALGNRVIRRRLGGEGMARR